MIKTRAVIVSFATVFLALYFSCMFATNAESGEPKKKKVKYVKSKDGLGTLMAMSGDRGKMIREFNNDTKSFEKISKAMNASRIKKGDTAKEIKKKYGEPVVIVPEDESGTLSRWVYKPGTGSFFEGNKAYLIFDQEGRLESFGVIPPAKPSE